MLCQPKNIAASVAAMSNIVMIFNVSVSTEIHTNIEPILINARADAKQAVTRGQANIYFSFHVVDDARDEMENTPDQLDQGRF